MPYNPVMREGVSGVRMNAAKAKKPRKKAQAKKDIDIFIAQESMRMRRNRRKGM